MPRSKFWTKHRIGRDSCLIVSLITALSLMPIPAGGQVGGARPRPGATAPPTTPSGKAATAAQQFKQIQDMVSSYKQKTVDETLTKIQALLEKPPSKYETAQSQLTEYLGVPREQLSEIHNLLLKIRAGEKTSLAQLRQKHVEIWQLIEGWAQQALKFQVEVNKHRAIIKKATEDAPKKFKALGEEFSAIHKRIGEFLKGLKRGFDKGSADRTESFVTTTASNVFKVMGDIIKEHEKLVKMKLSDPKKVKKRSDELRKAGVEILTKIEGDPELARLFGKKWKQIIEATKKNESAIKKALDELYKAGKLPDYRELTKAIDDQLAAAAAKISDEDFEYYRKLVKGLNEQMGSSKVDILRRVMSLEQITGSKYIVWGKYGLPNL